MDYAKKSLAVFRESIPFVLLIFFGVLIATDARYISVAFEGIKTYCVCVLPTVFPFVFITSVLYNLSFANRLIKALFPLTRTVFNAGGATGYAFFISLASGYPAGAKTVSDLKLSGLIKDSESVRAAAFCSSASPAYLIAGVGTVSFSSPVFGFALFSLHVLSVVATGFVFSFYNRKEKPTGLKTVVLKKSDAVLYDGAFSAVTSSLTLGALITVFYVMTEMLLNLGLLSLPVSLFSSVFGDKSAGLGLVTGLFECTRGIKTLSSSGLNFLSMPLCLFLSGFGGLSNVLQSVSFLKKAKIKTAPFLLSKVSTAVFGFIFGLIYSLFFF